MAANHDVGGGVGCTLRGLCLLSTPACSASICVRTGGAVGAWGCPESSPASVVSTCGSIERITQNEAAITAHITAGQPPITEASGEFRQRVDLQLESISYDVAV